MVKTQILPRTNQCCARCLNCHTLAGRGNVVVARERHWVIAAC